MAWGREGCGAPTQDDCLDPLALFLSTLLVAGTGVSCLTCLAHGLAASCPAQPQGQEVSVGLPKAAETWEHTVRSPRIHPDYSRCPVLHSLGPAQGLPKGTGRGDSRQYCKIAPTGVILWSQTDLGSNSGFLAD